MSRPPSEAQLILPLLETLDAEGGQARPPQLYDAIADRLALEPAERELSAVIGGRRYNTYERAVRWARQTCIRNGLVDGSTHGLWKLTEDGKSTLRNAKRGVVVTIFETEHGAAFWACAEEASRFISPSSVNLIVTSPPYALLKQKAYGNLPEAEWLAWMQDLAGLWRELLTDDGSLVLNLGPTWQRGQPTQSLAIERLTIRMVDDLGYHLAQRLYWHSPTKLPAPLEWVGVRRIRVKSAVEPVLWFSKTPHPKADNRQVLRPYSKRMREILAAGGEGEQVRPAGHVFGAGSFARDNGGAIPDELLSHAMAASQTRYLRECRARGLPIHPARMPEIIPDFAIRLTTVPGDLVYDPFGGSGTTAEVAERLGRSWLMTERSLTYLEGAAVRFPAAQRRGL